MPTQSHTNPRAPLSEALLGLCCRSTRTRRARVRKGSVKFRTRVWLVLLVVGVVPVALMGFQSFQANREELTLTVTAAQAHSASLLAAQTEDFVLRSVEGLQVSASALPLDSLSAADLAQVLRIPYRQLRGVNALVLLDARGNARVPPVYERDAAGEPPAGRDRVDDATLGQFAKKIPLAEALSLGAAVGPAYRSPSGEPRVAIAVRTSGDVIAAELSLSELAKRFTAFPERSGHAALVTGDGVLFGELSPELTALVRSPGAKVSEVGGELVALAPAPQLHWSVVVAQPVRIALGGADRVRAFTLYWAGIGLLLTVVLGTVLARGLANPINELRAGAKGLSEGRYDMLLPAGGDDELGALSRAFNLMAVEIRRRDSEIRAFNQELQARVEARTSELKLAQDQILRSRRLAALGSLGAGVAHEFNNPLTAVMGLVSLVRRELGDKSDQGQMLTQALDQVRRLATVVSQLRQFSEAEQEDAGKKLDLAQLIKDALGPFSTSLEQKQIHLHTQFAADVPLTQGDSTQLQQLISSLVENAITALQVGGTLRVCLSSIDGEALKLEVTDNGKGIPSQNLERIFDPFFSTKDDPSGVGLGLSLAHHIVEAHHGKLVARSEVGLGSTFTVVLPAAGLGAHLS